MPNPSPGHAVATDQARTGQPQPPYRAAALVSRTEPALRMTIFFMISLLLVLSDGFHRPIPIDWSRHP
jgi:hypothetical protein